MSNLMIEHIENFNSRNENHRMIRRTNNAIMLHKIHQYLKSRTDLKFAVDKKEFAYWLTALGMNESTSFTKESGTNNFFGITATKKQIADTERLTGREREFDFPPAKLVGTHEIGEVEGQGTTGTYGKQKRYFANYKTEKEGMDAFFDDVIFPNFPNVMKAKNSTEFVLALMKGKNNKMYATDFKFRKDMLRQSALPPVLEDTGELEPNIFSNQYWIKFHNFLGGVTRPDMTTMKVGNEELIVPSEEGKRGINHSPRGIKGGQYIDQKLFEKLENDPKLFDKVKNQKENINNNVDKANVKDMTSLDFFSTGVDDNNKQSITREMILNSYASNEYYGNMFVEKFSDELIGIDMGVGVETKKDGFSATTSTVLDNTGENITDVDYNLKYQNENLEINVGKENDKDKQSITFRKGGFKAKATKEDGRTGFGIEYRGKFK